MTDHTVSAPHYRLLILGDGSVRTVPLEGERWVVGRALECQIALRDPTVSRRHVLIERVGDRFHFQDLGGANPVLLDGKPAKVGVLAPDQTLSIGLTRLRLEQRVRAGKVAVNPQATVVLSREVADDEVTTQAPPDTVAGAATRVLERLEWSLADLGDLTHAAEPLLELTLHLTQRDRGWIGRFTVQDEVETLAALAVDRSAYAPRLPDGVLREARRIGRPHVLVTQEDGGTRQRLLVPFGPGPKGLLLLEEPLPGAPEGPELLRLAQSLGNVVWHRLEETTERQRLRDEVQRLRFHGSAAHNALLASTRLHDARQMLRSLAGGDEPVLLVGEDGTELEDLGRYLHAESPRRAQPFVAWNAVRVPDWRHARDLFGDRPGADCVVDRAGSGTLFVERFDWLSPELQRRLVDTVRERRTSSAAAPVLCLAMSQEHGTDGAGPKLEWLPHQRIAVPPLRSSPRDVLALAELFLSEMGTRPDGSPRLMLERAKRLLVGHSWPGNVRELRLVLESAAAQAADQPIAPRHLPPNIASDAAQAATPEIPTLEQIERAHIAEVMERTGGNRAKAASLLGIATSTLYDKLKRFGLAD
ncbi:MAG: sigma 54-dependent Fis family transcriptional regulator [Planctomycetes bacterium]|nr:sigma 54-dependent Fis family transcriptional regulator [Planctomycetota bacterium]